MSDERRIRAEELLGVAADGPVCWDEIIDAMLAFEAEGVAKERARYSALKIKPPNEEGKTQCIVRWLAETPHGWIGSWDKEALENVKSIERGEP